MNNQNEPLRIHPSLIDYISTISREVFLFGGGGGDLAQGLGITLFAFGGAYRPLATAHSDPLWARTCFGCLGEGTQGVWAQPKPRPSRVWHIFGLWVQAADAHTQTSQNLPKGESFNVRQP